MYGRKRIGVGAGLTGAAVIAMVAFGAGCKKSAPVEVEVEVVPDDPAEPPAPPVSALWALAPAETDLAIVIDHGGLASLARGLDAAVASLAGWPGGPSALQELERVMGPAAAALTAEERARFGVDLDRSAAVFFTEGDWLIVLSASDAATFALHVGGGAVADRGGGPLYELDGAVCAEREGRTLCASAERLLEPGARHDLTPRVGAWPERLRGHIEISVTPVDAPSVEVRVGVRLGSGLVTARAHIASVVPEAPMFLAGGPSRLAERMARAGAAGFLRVSQGPQLLAMARAGNRHFDGMTGEMVVYAPSTVEYGAHVEVGFDERRKLQSTVLHLCRLLQQEVPEAAVVRRGGGCRGRVPAEVLRDHGMVGDVGDLPFSIGGTRDAMRIGFGAASDGKVEAAPVPWPALAHELATGPWFVALWSRGRFDGPESFLPADAPVGVAATLGWALSHLRELGVGVGADRDGVHAVARITTSWARPERATDDRSGAMVLTAVGVLTAVAIPAFVQYVESSRERRD